MADHASLNVAVTFTGLTKNEATTVFTSLPAGTAARVVVRQPGIGGKRFDIKAEELSVQGAKELTAGLFDHVEAVANGEPSQPSEKLLNDVAFVLETASDDSLRDGLRSMIRQNGFGAEGRRLAEPIGPHLDGDGEPCPCTPPASWAGEA